EVEKLSRMITDAVEEITTINNNVVTAVESLSTNSMAMSAFIGESVVGDYDRFVEVGRDYGETMQTVQERMTDMREKSGTISEAIADINRDISGISTAVNESAAMIGELSASSGLISEEIKTLEKNSHENVEQTGRLSGDIQKYKF
ncbi:MAG: methyl-accepting chemotaxis protein, partial [Butyrivibrio sp.]|nr:methyl-accepting chemotaxis protein [Butyrivibrio sp.]